VSLLFVSNQADAQAPSAPRVNALNARETDDRYGLFDPILYYQHHDIMILSNNYYKNIVHYLLKNY